MVLSLARSTEETGPARRAGPRAPVGASSEEAQQRVGDRAVSRIFGSENRDVMDRFSR